MNVQTAWLVIQKNNKFAYCNRFFVLLLRGLLQYKIKLTWSGHKNMGTFWNCNSEKPFFLTRKNMFAFLVKCSVVLLRYGLFFFLLSIYCRFSTLKTEFWELQYEFWKLFTFVDGQTPPQTSERCVLAIQRSDLVQLIWLENGCIVSLIALWTGSLAHPIKILLKMCGRDV